MDFQKTYGFNKEKAEKGTWVDIGEGAKLLLCKIGTLEYNRALMLHSRKYQRLSQINRMDAEHTLDIMVKTLADTVLLGWSGMTESGREIPYSKTEALYRLREYPDFRELVQGLANDNTNFQDLELDLEADSGNLLLSSNGTSPSVEDVSNSLSTVTMTRE